MSAEQTKPSPWWRSGQALVVYGVLATMIFVAGFYAGRFGWALALPLSAKPDSWGAFGDYFGGVLNPVVALAALGLLAWSISIQRKELAESRKALHKQAESSGQLVKLNALSLMMVGKGNQVAYLDSLVAKHRLLHANSESEEVRLRELANIDHFERARGKYHSEQLEFFNRAKVLMDEIDGKSAEP